MFYYIMLYYVILYYIIAFDEGECSRNLVLGVLCHTARKNQGFLCNGSRRCQFSPPPPPHQRFLQGPTLSLKLVWTLASLS